MEETRYNNRQIERMLDQQTADITEHIRLIVEPLTAQVTKTNGRVTKMEKAVIVLGTALAALGVSNPEILKILALVF